LDRRIAFSSPFAITERKHKYPKKKATYVYPTPTPAAAIFSWPQPRGSVGSLAMLAAMPANSKTQPMVGPFSSITGVKKQLRKGGR
jgi:hypothetical protein